MQRVKRTDQEWKVIHDDQHIRQKLTVTEIAKNLNQQVTTVGRAFRRLGLPIRKNPDHKVLFNDKAFDRWTRESAYWLGFIAADGSVFAPKRTLSVSVQKQDKGHLEKLQQFLKSSKQVYEYVHHLNGKQFVQCYLNLVSRHLIARLESLGIVQNKSHKDIDYLRYVPGKYKLSFIFGFMDGDGHIRIRDRGRGEVAWLGTATNISSIAKYLSSINVRNSIKIRNDCGLAVCYVYDIASRIKVLKRYLKHPVFLLRKHEKATNMLAIIKTLRAYKRL